MLRVTRGVLCVEEKRFECKESPKSGHCEWEKSAEIEQQNTKGGETSTTRYDKYEWVEVIPVGLTRTVIRERNTALS